MKTINFCGDSFVPEVKEGDYWHLVLADMLGAKIIGFGMRGSAHEHAMKIFNPDADITVFVWTEHGRVYNKKIPFGNITSINDRLKTSTSANWYKPFPTNKPEKLDSLLKLYYMYLYEDDVSKERQIRDLYWFDNEVLSKYNGQIVHLFSFDVTYKFKNGITYSTPLYDIARSDTSLPRVGKFSVSSAKFLANEVFAILNDENN